MTEPKPCPFCGWEKIRIIEDVVKKEPCKGWKFMFCYCRVCGTRGPSAYNISQDEKKNCEDCICRWNERDGIHGMKREDMDKES